MKNFFIDSVLDEIPILINDKPEKVEKKLKKNIMNLTDHTGGNILHFFAKNPRAKFINQKILLLINKEVDKNQKDKYGKIPVEYLLSLLDKKINNALKYQDFIVDDEYHYNFREIEYFKSILKTYELILPTDNQFLSEKLINEIDYLKNLIISKVRFKDGDYFTILEKNLLNNIKSPPIKSQNKKRL